LAELDPNLVLVEPERLPAVLGRETARDTFVTLLVSVFAGLAVSLAALGIYGILSYDISRSRHEIGVRMALGAGAPEVRGMIARRGLALTAAGIVAGTLGALVLSRLLESLLFEVSPYDPRVVGAAALLVLAIGVVASWVPAQRATSVEPAEAFRGSERRAAVVQGPNDRRRIPNTMAWGNDRGRHRLVPATPSASVIYVVRTLSRPGTDQAKSTPAGAVAAVVTTCLASTTSAASGATAALPPAARVDSTQSSATVSDSTAIPIRSLVRLGLPKIVIVSISSLEPGPSRPLVLPYAWDGGRIQKVAFTLEDERGRGFVTAPGSADQLPAASESKRRARSAAASDASRARPTPRAPGIGIVLMIESFWRRVSVSAALTSFAAFPDEQAVSPSARATSRARRGRAITGSPGRGRGGRVAVPRYAFASPSSTIANPGSSD
jgi:hypothetical protein